MTLLATCATRELHSSALIIISHQTIDLRASRFGSERYSAPHNNLFAEIHHGTQRLAEYCPPTQRVGHPDPGFKFYYPYPGSSYQYPRYDQHALRYDQLNFRYDQHVPFGSVFTGGSADIFPGSGFRERVADDVCIPSLCIRALADTATSADI